MSIANNLSGINERIAAACARAGRPVNDVKLIAVSKTKPAEKIQEAIAAGQTVFGENYVQEALEKMAQEMSQKMGQLTRLDWHLVGTVQTNKAKSIAGKFSLIHSVDRPRIARELAKVSGELSIVQDVLVQVHIGDEVSKSGFSPQDLPEILTELRALPSLRVRGLMTMPPLTDDESKARANFGKLRELLNENADGSDFKELSMGTTTDFEWAILEGATLVRVGTAIFGARDY